MNKVLIFRKRENKDNFFFIILYKLIIYNIILIQYLWFIFFYKYNWKRIGFKNFFFVIKNLVVFILYSKYKVNLFKEIIFFYKNFFNIEIILLKKEIVQWYDLVKII